MARNSARARGRSLVPGSIVRYFKGLHNEQGQLVTHIAIGPMAVEIGPTSGRQALAGKAVRPAGRETFRNAVFTAENFKGSDPLKCINPKSQAFGGSCIERRPRCCMGFGGEVSRRFLL